MVYIRTTDGGVEEWSCPTCGRRLLLRWPPSHARLVIEPGDETVRHVGAAAPAGSHGSLGSGGGSAGGSPAGGSEPDAPVPGQQDRNWLREIGIDWDAEPA
jgi:hypothetical protein